MLGLGNGKWRWKCLKELVRCQHANTLAGIFREMPGISGDQCIGSRRKGGFEKGFVIMVGKV
jgi:hypothetical protein